MGLKHIILILINLFILSLSLNDTYYTYCEYGAASEFVNDTLECQKYKPIDPDIYCCRFYLKNDNEYSSSGYYTYTYYYYVYYKQKNNNTNTRKLEYKSSCCIGITVEGYFNIKKVIKDYAAEFKLDSEYVHIDCLSKYLKIFNIGLFTIILSLL